MDYDKIVLNVPHSSLLGLYDSEYSGWKENPAFECDCVIKWTDWATDNIFAPNHNLKVNVDMCTSFSCHDSSLMPKDLNMTHWRQKDRELSTRILVVFIVRCHQRRRNS